MFDDVQQGWLAGDDYERRAERRAELGDRDGRADQVDDQGDDAESGR